MCSLAIVLRGIRVASECAFLWVITIISSWSLQHVGDTVMIQLCCCLSPFLIPPSRRDEHTRHPINALVFRYRAQIRRIGMRNSMVWQVGTRMGQICGWEYISVNRTFECSRHFRALHAVSRHLSTTQIPKVCGEDTSAL